MKRLIIVILFIYSLALAHSQTSNTWSRIADFSGPLRAGAISFTINGMAYVGCFGIHDTTGGPETNPTDLWQYNPVSNTWIQKTNYPGHPGYGGICFTIGSKVYIGIGYSNLFPQYNKDFWEYDASTDLWTQKADFAGGPRVDMISFSIGNKGYAGTGTSDTAGLKNDFWEYDPAVDTWTQKNDFTGGVRDGAIGFGILNNGYIGLGVDASYHIKKDFWRYDPISDTWSQIASYPSSAISGIFNFTIADKEYFGGGIDSNYTSTYSNLWEYNSISDIWIEKDSFGGGRRVAATGFSINNKGYAGIGYFPDLSHFQNDFWVYTPDSISTGINDITNSDFTFYPNPVNDKLYISPALMGKMISISDASGRSWPTMISGNEIDVSGLSAGIYFFRMQLSDGNLLNKKFIKL